MELLWGTLQDLLKVIGSLHILAFLKTWMLASMGKQENDIYLSPYDTIIYSTTILIIWYSLKGIVRYINFTFIKKSIADIANMRSLIRPELIIPLQRLTISIVCSNRDKTGGHAFLFFEWCLKNCGCSAETCDCERFVRMFGRADFAFHVDSNEEITTSDLIRGKPKITVEVIEDNSPNLTRAKQLLGKRHAEFQSVNYPFAANEDIKAKILELKNEENNFTYNSKGDHSSTSINSRTNNQNCATWCLLVLKENFRIKLKLKNSILNLVVTPRAVVHKSDSIN